MFEEELMKCTRLEYFVLPSELEVIWKNEHKKEVYFVNERKIINENRDNERGEEENKQKEARKRRNKRENVNNTCKITTNYEINTIG